MMISVDRQSTVKMQKYKDQEQFKKRMIKLILILERINDLVFSQQQIRLNILYYFQSLIIIQFIAYPQMIPQPEKQIKDIMNAQEPDSRNFKQTFQYGNHTITHQHSLEVQLTQEKTQSLEVINNFATKIGDKLFKITQIHYQDRIIKIIDVFTSILNPQFITEKLQPISNPETQNYTRHTLLPKKNKTNSSQCNTDQSKMRDTKNVVKNIFRLFQSWVDLHFFNKPQIKVSLNQLLKQSKFNNNLIMRLSKFTHLRKSFIEFTQNQGKQYVMNSKINDKQSHLLALQKYRNICCGEQELAIQKQFDSDKWQDRVKT